jgi:predicted nuclease of predicted toxin-antitoxin system
MLKFLADVNIEKRIVVALRESGFDVLWIPDYDCGMNDRALLKLATAEQRVLITNDTDFGELFFRHRIVSSGVILFRVEGDNTLVKITLLKNLLLRHNEKVENCFVIISRKRVRIIPLEDVT